MKTNKYSLFTTIGMIVGIVIGSGIFFKSDNILVATNGSITLGILIFSLAAIGIIFGGLSIAELASRTDKDGGIIAYLEDHCNSSIACAFGWVFTILYYPTLIAVIAWVSAIYFCQLFAIDANLGTQILIGLLILLSVFLLNILSKKLGGYVQNAATIIKLIPLLFIALAGLFLGDTSSVHISHITNMNSLGWVSAIVPIAFAYDGWIVSTSISHEIKNPKRNLPIALIVAPIFILLIYIAYFTGISTYLGPEKVMELGDGHVAYAANQLLGNFGGKIILIFINISVLGTLNGLILGSIRMPHSLALRKMLPMSDKLSKMNKDLDISITSALFSLFFSLLWLVIHYITQKFNLLPNSDVSEIAVIFSYLIYIVLFIQIIRLSIKGEIKSFLRGKLNPILAICGSLIIILGSINNPLFIYYAIIFLLIIVVAIIFFNKKNRQ